MAKPIPVLILVSLVILFCLSSNLSVPVSAAIASEEGRRINIQSPSAGVVPPTGKVDSAALLSPTTLFNTLNTRTFSYGGTPAIQVDTKSWLLDYPAQMQQSGMFSGTDVVSRADYFVDVLQFDAKFTGGSNALSYDEMVIFCTSTLSYNGTEYGVRYMLQTNEILGYTQASSQTFEMVPLMMNDGELHHYAISVKENVATFYIDGFRGGSLTLQGDSPYRAYGYWVTIAVHRYSGGWNSTGYRMEVRNVSINAAIRRDNVLVAVRT
jgi:hypothetical protein